MTFRRYIALLHLDFLDWCDRHPTLHTLAAGLTILALFILGAVCIGNVTPL